MRPLLLGAPPCLPFLLLACSFQTGVLVGPGTDGGTADVGGDGAFPDTIGPDTGMPTDTSTPMDTSTPSDTSTPMDTGSPPMDTWPPGPTPGTDLWTRLGPGYDSSDFQQSMNVHFEGGEIHVPMMCRPLEMVTIADPVSMSWRNYEVLVTRLRFDDHDCGGNSTFTLVARTQSRTADCASQAGYGCSIDIDRDRLYVGRRNASCGWIGGQREQMDTGSVNTGEQYSLKIQVRGSTVTCIFDDGSDEYTVSYTDVAATYGAGGVGFIFEEVDARFGDPSVTAL
jgi:hypothetical protein